MNIDEWKSLSDTERSAYIKSSRLFNPYTGEAYELVRSLGREMAEIENLNQEKVGVLNRFGELIIHLHVPEEELAYFKGRNERNYFGFRVFYSSERSWFDH